jgi:hypothetical protein
MGSSSSSGSTGFSASQKRNISEIIGRPLQDLWLVPVIASVCIAIVIFHFVRARRQTKCVKDDRNYCELETGVWLRDKGDETFSAIRLKDLMENL